MPRKGPAPWRELAPDPVHNSLVLTQLINKVMLHGKRSIAEKIVYDAMGIVAAKTGDDPLETVKRADSATQLGGAQAIVDGCRLAWVRPAPARDLLQALWTLLPTSTRGELSIATFAFGNAPGYDAVVVPRIASDQFDRRYLSEEQAANYPEGRYELAVQSAAESGDQAMLDGLFARRSRAEIWRLGVRHVGWPLKGALEELREPNLSLDRTVLLRACVDKLRLEEKR